ncbi:glycosyltransferase family 4 protein [Niabella sp. CC-SYL272]|uniref:glycosyltransferase family 4 protein n=1 Tax=Niabella agricola TaxID=2891571 RepID=UPI002103E982|nr:glycosyltransferase family 4 protein [Niabella agricola]MCF3107513.1 glycosyltransferase family 4 protein [Niabella agricola]
MKKLWIISELFFPEETSTSFILTKIANKLAEKYSVEVICGEPVYDKKKSPSNKNFYLDNKIQVNRLSSFKGNKDRPFFRMLRFILLSFRFFITTLIKTKKGDIVFTVTNPAPFILLVALLRKIKKFKLIILIHDVFPENTIPAGMIRSPETLYYRILKRLFDRAYAGADKLIVLGRDMLQVVQEKVSPYKHQPQLLVIENWGDAANIHPRNKEEVIGADSPILRKIVFQYAGNLGRVQGLMELLEVIRKIKNDHLAFQFIGTGAMKPAMIRYVNQHQLANVQFGDAYSRDDQNTILNSSDIAIITLAKGMYGLGVPSKTYNVLMAGKPILFIGEKESEIGLLIKEAAIGYSFEHSDTPGLLDFFNKCDSGRLLELKKMGQNARDYALKNYSEEVILKKIMNSI